MAEKSLIKKLKKGQEDAYIFLVEQYGNRLLSSCYLILKDRQEAEDIVQETFIRVFKKIHTFKGNSSLYTWIYSIALNQSRDRLKKKYDCLIFEEAWIENENVDLEYQVEKKFDRELLRKELFQMNVIYREVLVLFYFEEFSIKEIANLLDEKEGTIKSKLSRGRNILKESLLKGGQLNG